MNKLVLLACAIAGFVGTSLGGTQLRWNQFLHRWEQYDDGQMTGSSQYNNFSHGYDVNNGTGQHVGTWRWNSFLHQWEWQSY
jgi:hypothetical protein